MNRLGRMTLFFVGGGGLAVLLALAFLDMPPFGSAHHPYRDHAVAGAAAHNTANAVSSVNFDQRAIDTLGEESILLASVVGVAVLLRPAREEHEVAKGAAGGGHVLESTRAATYVMLPVTLVLGLNLIAHGHLTPGGGFQGGVVLATGFHLLYVGGRYEALERLRPEAAFEWGEAVGAAAFAGLGLAAIGAGGAFLANVVPTGTFGTLLSGGTVPILNGAVGIEVACGVVVLLAKFLRQDLEIRSAGERTAGAA